MACPDTGDVSTTKAIASAAKVMIAAFSVATEEARDGDHPRSGGEALGMQLTVGVASAGRRTG